MGTPDFALPALKILLDNEYPIVSVVTVPDKPAPRRSGGPQRQGKQFIPSPVKKFALQHQLPVLQPASLGDPSLIGRLKSLEADLFVVVAFRILPKEILSLPRVGAFNLHASLLPKYRGAAPIHWAIINGEKETGVTTFFLEEKVDTGNIILQARVPIGPDETFGELHDKLGEVGAEIALHTVRLIEMGKAIPKSQNDGEATTAPKIFKEQCRIDWTRNARQVHNFVRGLSPSPCAFTIHGEKSIKIYRTKIEPSVSPEAPGTVCETNNRLVVATTEEGIEILEVQQEGRRKMSAEEFLRGYRIKKGDQFS